MKKQLEAKKEFLNLNTEIRKQMRTTIDCQKKKEETNRIEELREKQKQLQTTIDGHTNTEETNNPSIYELREEQKKLQATIDDLRKTLEPYVSTCKLEDIRTIKWAENLPAINLVNFGHILRFRRPTLSPSSGLVSVYS